MIDFEFTNHGSVVFVTAVSHEAKEIANESFPVEAWQGRADDFTTDWRAGLALYRQLDDEGWEIRLTGEMK